MDLRTGILGTADRLGMDPLDLATIISYETAGTFDPTKRGPTTQWGQHRGLIQFGEPQAREYGVNWNDPIGSQLGEGGAVERYFRGNGWQPGMGMLDAYSIVNAGGPGLYNRSDANNGGAPGTVADKVRDQMGGHRAKAAQLLGIDVANDTMAALGRQPMGQQMQVSTKGAPTGLLGAMPEEERGGILGLLGMQPKWAGKANDIGAVLLALSGSPAAQPLLQMVQDRKQSKREDARMNRTAEWLASQGRPDLAEAVAGGIMSSADAARILMTPAEATRGVVVGGNVVDPVTGSVIYEGPEQPVGDMTPAAFKALDLQAQAAGFAPGSSEYKDFMATRGAGLAAESRAIGEARGSAIAGAPVDVATADTTLGFIDEVRSHPGLDIGTGATSVANIVPGTPGYDFQNRVNQLLSGGFLTAIDQLRGMGALSNAEGQTATRAISRMDTATSKPEFLEALSDYEAVVKMGRERAARRIPQPQGDNSAPTAAPPGAAPSDGAMPSDDELLRMYGG